MIVRVTESKSTPTTGLCNRPTPFKTREEPLLGTLIHMTKSQAGEEHDHVNSLLTKAA